MTDQKKPPPANVDELKARLGLVKKKEEPKGAGPAQARPVPGPMVPPGIKGPPGVAPPPFLQAQKAAPDMRRDPFAKDVGAEYVRQSLVEGPKVEEMVVSAEDQKKMARRSRNITIIIAAAVGLACMLGGMFWGRGISSRLIYNLSIEDGKKLYDILQYSSKTLSDIKAKIVSAQQKANKERVADYKLMSELKDLAKTQGCQHAGEETEVCVLRLADLANRSYNIYKPEIVQTLFTYASQWNDLFLKMETHVRKTQNDQKALDTAKDKIETLIKTDYGVLFVSRQDPGTEENVMYGNLAIIASPIFSKDGQRVEGFNMQGGVGYPAIEKTLYVGGDLMAEPEKYVVPLGPETKQGLMLRQQINHFMEYQTRLQEMIDLGNQMDQNQKSLLISLGEIASLDKQFAF